MTDALREQAVVLLRQAVSKTQADDVYRLSGSGVQCPACKVVLLGAVLAHTAEDKHAEDCWWNNARILLREINSHDEVSNARW